MAFKFVAFAALVAAANAGILAPAPLAYHAAPAYAAAPAYGYAAPLAKAVVTKTIDAEYDPNPQYSYSYDVQDSITGDNKQQQETRNGDVVEGSYSLVEADGTRRVVHYTADPHNGFNAVVEKQPAAVAVKTIAAPVVAKYAAPLSYAAAPVVAKYAAPLSYAAGPVVAKYAAPIAHAPVAYAAAHHAPLSYAAPIAHAPVAYAAAHHAPLSYAAPIAHAAYASPAYAYHH